LANFWQDVTVDTGKDRVYLPQDLLARHGVTDADLFARRFTPGFARVMEEACGVARRLFEEGLALPGMVDRRLALDLRLFSEGGLAVLDKIERQGWDVLKERPKIGKLERVGLLLKALWVSA
jgi:phytoene/squalene synthetase